MWFVPFLKCRTRNVKSTIARRFARSSPLGMVFRGVDSVVLSCAAAAASSPRVTRLCVGSSSFYIMPFATNTPLVSGGCRIVTKETRIRPIKALRQIENEYKKRDVYPKFADSQPKILVEEIRNLEVRIYCVRSGTRGEWISRWHKSSALVPSKCNRSGANPI